MIKYSVRYEISVYVVFPDADFYGFICNPSINLVFPVVKFPTREIPVYYDFSYLSTK